MCPPEYRSYHRHSIEEKPGGSPATRGYQTGPALVAVLPGSGRTRAYPDPTAASDCLCTMNHCPSPERPLLFRPSLLLDQHANSCPVVQLEVPSKSAHLMMSGRDE